MGTLVGTLGIQTHIHMKTVHLITVFLVLKVLLIKGAFDTGTFVRPRWLERFPKLHVPLASRPASTFDKYDPPEEESKGRQRRWLLMDEEEDSLSVLQSILGEIEHRMKTVDEQNEDVEEHQNKATEDQY